MCRFEEFSVGDADSDWIGCFLFIVYVGMGGHVMACGAGVYYDGWGCGTRRRDSIELWTTFCFICYVCLAWASGALLLLDVIGAAHLIC